MREYVMLWVCRRGWAEMTVLVAIEAGGRTAGVVVEEGHAQLTPQVGGESWWGQIVSDHRAVTVDRDGTWLAGGVLLPGAVAVRVIDTAGRHHAVTVGEGAWIAELAGPGNVFVCQLDGSGAAVAPQRPASWQREPVGDAVEPCPACGSVAWEQITADDGSRGRHGFEGEETTDTPFVACSACGHEEGSVGGWASAYVEMHGEPADAEALERQRREWEAEQRRQARARLANATVPIFVPVDLEVTLVGWSGGDGEPVDGVTVMHRDVLSTPWIEVESERDEAGSDPLAEAADRLSSLLQMYEDPPQRSEAAQVVWEAAHRRAQKRAVAEMPVEVGTRSLRVDGELAPFAVALSGDRWVAIGEVGHVLVKVTAFGVEFDEVELRALSHPLHLAPEPADDLPAERYREPPSRRDPFDIQIVDELVRASALADLAPQVVALARPTLMLNSADDEAGLTKLGGEPDLPDDMAWPAGGGLHGTGPSAFVAQVDLAVLDRAVWPGPRQGVLSIFCGIDAADMDPDHSTLILHAPGTVLQRRSFPADLPDELHFAETRLTAGVGLTLPDVGVEALAPLWDWDAEESEGLDEALTDVTDRLEREHGGGLVRILGWPTLSQTDVMSILADGDAEDWSLLIEAPVMEVRLYVGVRTADLAAGRLNRARAYIEHWD